MSLEQFIRGEVKRRQADRRSKEEAELLLARREEEKWRRDAREYVMTKLKRDILAALDAGRTSLPLCKVDGPTKDVAALTNYPRALADELVAAGLKHRLWIDIDCSGNPAPQDRLMLRLDEGVG